jgi:hypothetical protein
MSYYFLKKQEDVDRPFSLTLANKAYFPHIDLQQQLSLQKEVQAKADNSFFFGKDRILHQIAIMMVSGGQFRRNWQRWRTPWVDYSCNAAGEFQFFPSSCESQVHDLPWLC